MMRRTSAKARRAWIRFDEQVAERTELVGRPRELTPIRAVLAAAEVAEAFELAALGDHVKVLLAAGRS